MTVALAAPAMLVASACTGDDPVLARPGPEGDASTDQGAPADSAVDGAVLGIDAAPPDAAAGCNPLAPFSIFTNVAGLNTTGDELGFTLTPDELQAVLITYGTGAFATYSTSRVAKTDKFGALRAELTTVNDPLAVALTSDPTVLYYTHGGAGELLKATRGSLSVPFAGVAGVTGPSPTLNAGKRGVFAAQSGNLFVTVEPVGPLPTEIWEWVNEAGNFLTGKPVLTRLGLSVSDPVVSKGGTKLFYVTTDGAGSRRIHETSRTALSAGFPDGTVVAELRDNDDARPHFVSDDECRLYFSTRARASGVGGYDVWVASRGQ